MYVWRGWNKALTISYACPYVCTPVYSLFVYECCDGHRNGVQYDVSVGLDTLYVTKSHDPNEPMVTLRSAVLDNGYITTIRAKDRPSWLSRGEVVESFFSSVHSGLAYEKASLHGISSLSKEEMMSAIDASSKKKKK